MYALIHSFLHSEGSSMGVLPPQIFCIVPGFPLEAESNSKEICTATVCLQFN